VKQWQEEKENVRLAERAAAKLTKRNQQPGGPSPNGHQSIKSGAAGE